MYNVSGLLSIIIFCPTEKFLVVALQLSKAPTVSQSNVQGSERNECICVLQTALLSAGGLGVQVEDRCRRIGPGLHQEASGAPAACRRAVWTPNTTATVTQTALSGTLCLLQS